MADERRAARLVIERLRTDPLLRNQVDLDIIAWDDPDAATPMLATMTPQEAINRGLAKPADCEIVIVILWARLGTPLPADYVKPDGTRFLSGTEWEYWDAVEASRKADGLPLVVVYRRAGAPALQLDDPKFADKYEQWQRVQTFFADFTDSDGSIRQGYNTHTSTDDFSRQLEVHLKQLIRQVVDAFMRRAVPPPPVKAEPARLWQGSPFPGLRSFTPADEPIFYGRGAETDALVERLRGQRVVAVVGASGSGKSSLVGAGLLPRLAANSIDGSKDWLLPDAEPGEGAAQWNGLRFTPGEINDNPFDALAAKLGPLIGRTPRQVSAELLAEPGVILTLLNDALTNRPDWAEALLFIDQFEELYTLCAAQHRAPFIALLAQIAASTRARAVLTLRADFFARAVDDTTLAALLESGTFPLSVPGAAALYEMIIRPAERAGLEFDEGLAARILDETGADPGALALLAYALDQLYRRSAEDGRLSFEDYRDLGGVQAAIGERAEAAFNQLPAQAQAAFGTVFRELVEVDERGEPTRRRARLEPLTAEPGADSLIRTLTNERLLVTGRGEGGAVVEVAHEALLRTWDRLRLWLDEQVSDLQLRRRLEGEARMWANAQRKTDYILLGSRLEEAERWAATFPAPPEVARFIEASTAQRVQRRADEERRKAELLNAAAAAQESQRLAEAKVSEAQQSAERAERQRRRAQTAIISALFFVCVAAAVGTFALVQTNTANLAQSQAADSQFQARDAQTQAAVAQLEAGNAQTQAAVAQLEAGDAQSQVLTQVAALNAIVPGATRGAQLNNWESSLDSESKLNLVVTQGAPLRYSDNDWMPMTLAFDDGVPMVLVPPGCFMMGSHDGPPDEQPVNEQCFDAPFWIDVTEVTQVDFERLGGLKLRADSFDGDQRPVENINWFEARDFCARRGARLPTEREWEYAARGPDAVVYPWGNTWNESNAVWNNNSDRQMANVGSIPAGRSWVGAMDMSGNVWEWTSSLYLPYNSTEDREADTGTSTDVRRVLRGGSWGNFRADNLRAGSRVGGNPGLWSFDLGFRCARSS
ncbi:MAG: SUMF1/EgtB/PvdO family nonheme iron enzyme [Anaerolineae bacterium]|nr:SUMF1/EgtB/PvdO family nonheme iron enzyme [Anaerolineae bacterium]